MAISVITCPRLLLKILADFQFGVYPQSLALKHATTHSRDRCHSLLIKFTKNGAGSENYIQLLLYQKIINLK